MNYIFLLLTLGVATIIIFGISSSSREARSQHEVGVKPNESPAVDYDKISTKSTGSDASNLIHSSQNLDMDKSRSLLTSMITNNSNNNTNNTSSALPDDPLKNSLQQTPNNNIGCNPLNYDPSICHLGPTIPWYISRFLNGNDVKVGFGIHQVREDIPDSTLFQVGHFVAQSSKDCSGIIHPNEEKTCTITNTIR